MEVKKPKKKPKKKKPAKSKGKKKLSKMAKTIMKRTEKKGNQEDRQELKTNQSTEKPEVKETIKADNTKEDKTKFNREKEVETIEKLDNEFKEEEKKEALYNIKPEDIKKEKEEFNYKEEFILWLSQVTSQIFKKEKYILNSKEVKDIVRDIDLISEKYGKKFTMSNPILMLLRDLSVIVAKRTL